MKKLFILITILLFRFQSNSQQTTVSFDDASNFLEEYFSPLGESFGSGLNNGWYNTAKPHKLLGFDITLTLNTVSIPNKMQHFNPNSLDNFSSNQTISPTILGAGEGATIIYENSNTPVSFTMPDQGILKKSLIPVPMINAGIGLIKKTEIDIRYLPTYNFDMGFVGKGTVGLWGVAAKHDLLQYIPIFGDVIPMSLSIQAGHTQFNTSFTLDWGSSGSNNQDISMDIKATTINLIASKKLLMFTAYAGVGYNSSVTNFQSNTSFSIDNVNISNLPLELNFETQNEVRADIGLRFNLTIITLHANHTFSKYPVTTIGVGVSLR